MPSRTETRFFCPGPLTMPAPSLLFPPPGPTTLLRIMLRSAVRELGSFLDDLHPLTIGPPISPFSGISRTIPAPPRRSGPPIRPLSAPHHAPCFSTARWNCARLVLTSPRAKMNGDTTLHLLNCNSNITPTKYCFKYRQGFGLVLLL